MKRRKKAEPEHGMYSVVCQRCLVHSSLVSMLRTIPYCDPGGVSLFDLREINRIRSLIQFFPAKIHLLLFSLDKSV